MVNFTTQVLLMVSAAGDMLFDCLFIRLLSNRKADLWDQLSADHEAPGNNIFDPTSCGQHCSSLQNEFLVTYRIYVCAIAFLSIASAINLYWLRLGDSHRVANYLAARVCEMFQCLWPAEYPPIPDTFYAQLLHVGAGAMFSTLETVFLTIFAPCDLLSPLWTGLRVNLEDESGQRGYLGLSNATFAWTGWYFWIDQRVPSTIRASLCLVIGVPHFLLVWSFLVLRSWVVLAFRLVVFLSMVSLLLVTTLCCWLLAISSSELNYYFFGLPTQEYHWNSTVSGLLSEDLAQIIIQATYAIISTISFGKHISWVQWSSFAFTIWRLSFSLSYKWMNRDKKAMRVFLSKAEPIPTTATGTSLPDVAVELREESKV